MPINNPRDIPGLVAWYSAQAETSYADNADMTSWTDLSGNANHASVPTTAKPKWRSTAGPAGGPAVQWATHLTSRYFLMPNVLAALTAAEVLVAIKADPTGAAAESSGSPLPWHFTPSVDGADVPHYPLTADSKVYESFGLSAGQRKMITPTMTIDVWRRYNIWSAASDWAARLDAVSQLTSATATPAFPTAPRIGAPAFYSDRGFRGHMACVVIYNRKLTTIERDDLDAWLVANPSGGALTGISVPVAAAVTDWVTPPVSLPIHTDNSNGMGGWQLGGYATARVTTPVAANPFPGDAGIEVEAAKYLPPPTIENGEIK